MNDVPPPHAPIRFGVFELDTESGELRKQGVKVKLQEQPFQILRILLEHPGRVVSRTELQQRIWASDTFVDFDRGLYNAIKKLREALGDLAESPRFVETLFRRGYRFIAPVNGSVIQPRTSAASVTRDSIVVLPFINTSADPENEFIADGITEEVINALTQLPQLKVVARSSAFSFKGKHVDPRVVGEQLKVRTILEGSVRRAENRLRITAQLVNTEDGYHQWSERYDREIKDIFEVQDEIARSIASRLKVTLEDKPTEPLVKAGTKSIEAYSLYAKGRALLYRRGASLPVAMECFRQAVSIDPDYALAWACIADGYSALALYGFMHPGISRPRWQEAARRAVAAEPSLAEAHCSLALGSLLFDWNKAEAEREFVRALELNSRYIQGRGWYAMFYLQFAAGRLSDGVAEMKLALEFDPLSAYVNSMLSLTYSDAGQYGEAIRAAERAVELDPESYPAWGSLELGLLLSGQFEESVAAGQNALAVAGRQALAMAALTVSLSDLGKTAEAETVYAELKARACREYVLPTALACAGYAVGRQDEAIQHVRRALSIGDASRCFLSTYWPYCTRLRKNPEIDRLLKEHGIP